MVKKRPMKKLHAGVSYNTQIMHIPPSQLKDEEIARLKLDIMQTDKLCEGIKRKLRAVEEDKAQLESARDTLKRQIGSMERG